MTQFWDVGALWESSRSAIHTKLRVADPYWTDLRTRLKAAEKELASQAGGGASDAFRAVRRLSFQLSSLPLPIGHPLLWGDQPEGVIEQISDYGRAHQLDSVLSLTGRLREFVQTGNENPLWSALVSSWVSLERPIALVARKPSAVGPLEARIDALPGAPVPIVVTLSELPDVRSRKTTVVFGPPSLYPVWLKTFPHNNVLWIYHAWNRDIESVGSLLSFAQGTNSSSKVKPHEKSFSGHVSVLDSTAEEDLTYVLNQEQVEREISSYASQGDDTSVSARIALLANDECVLLPVDEGTSVSIFDPAESRVRREVTRKIVPGMFVIVRESGGRDHIRALVETKFMRDVPRAKAQLEEWKHELRLRIRERGLGSVKRELEELDVVVEAGSINLWTTDLVYGPGRQDWFRSLLTYLGIGGFQEKWETLISLRRAGRRAGLYMRDQLLRQATEVDPVTARRSSTLRFTIDGVDGGALIAHKVEEVLPKVIQTPSALIGQPIGGNRR